MKNKKIVIGIVIAIVCTAAYLLFQMNQAVKVDLQSVKRGNLEDTVEETGVIKTRQDRKIISTVTGKVQQLLVEVGDEVKAGAVLLRIDPEEMNIQLRGLEAQREALAAQYREAVKPMDQEEIRKLQIEVETSQIRYEEAKRQAENNELLYKEGAVSFEEYRKARVNLDVESAALKLAKLNLEVGQKSASEHVRAQFEGQMKQLDAQIALLQRQMGDLEIKVPIDGMILVKYIEAGSYIQPGMPLFDIGDRGQLYIESDILAGEMAEVREGLPVEISNEDLKIAGLSGTITKIYPVAFSKVSDLGIEQKRIRIEVSMQDGITALRPGYDMDLKIITDRKENILLIPDSAVFEINGEDHVFVNQTGKAALRKIRKGISQRDQVEVLEGLQEGEEVILSPNDKIKEGIKIQPKDQ